MAHRTPGDLEYDAGIAALAWAGIGGGLVPGAAMVCGTPLIGVPLGLVLGPLCAFVAAGRLKSGGLGGSSVVAPIGIMVVSTPFLSCSRAPWSP